MYTCRVRRAARQARGPGTRPGARLDPGRCTVLRPITADTQGRRPAGTCSARRLSSAVRPLASRTLTIAVRNAASIRRRPGGGQQQSISQGLPVVRP